MFAIKFSDLNAQYAKDKRLKREDVTKLEEWQIMQPHLPAPQHPIEVALALHTCFYNNEMAKQLIDSFYTIRTQCPEFFANRDPFGVEIQQALDTCLVTMLPNLTPEGDIVLYARLLDRKPNKYDYNAAVKIADMIGILGLLERGCSRGVVGILDLEGATLAHLLKSNLLSIKKASDYLQNAVPVRITSLHAVNAVSFIDKILAIARHVFSAELFDKVHVHFMDNATIFKHVPKDILPIECGGSSFSATNYYKNITRTQIENLADYFKWEESRRIDESKRPLKAKNTMGLNEVEGTFKNLEID